ncbi:MAG: CapA family protein [Clostridiales bacterium]|nr:CapA family protein [Clostridiales bacterium]
MEKKQRMRSKMPLRDRVLAYVVEKHRRLLVLPLVIAVVLLATLVISSSATLSNLKKQTATPHDPKIAENDPNVKLSFFGDIVFGRTIARLGEQVGYDKLFIPTADLILDSDIIMANLDMAVIKGDIKDYPKIDKYSYYYTEAKNIEHIKNAGFNVLSLANDHIADLGREVMPEVFDTLNSLGISYVGAGYDNVEAGAYKKFDVNGKTVAILSMIQGFPNDYTSKEGVIGVASSNNANVTLAVNNARSKCDIVIVYVNWGHEYMLTPNESMRKLGQKLIDAGATMVVGANPRVVLPVERYRNGLIAYSLGSYIFDDASSRTCDSIALNMTMDTENNISVEVIPLRINSGVPELTSNALYTNRIFTTITKFLEDDSYTITNSKLQIKLG